VLVSPEGAQYKNVKQKNMGQSLTKNSSDALTFLYFFKPIVFTIPTRHLLIF
jgi:hypothetical protein